MSQTLWHMLEQVVYALLVIGVVSAVVAVVGFLWLGVTLLLALWRYFSGSR
ncbi:MAG: hypothetical protein RLZZ393_583 [Pseudomonadota bacterium]|jgi:hypothetical protein